MNRELLEQIVADDMLGLLDEAGTKSEYRLVYGMQGEEKITSRHYHRKYEKAKKRADMYKEAGFEGCITRHIKKGDEWILTASEEF